MPHSETGRGGRSLNSALNPVKPGITGRKGSSLRIVTVSQPWENGLPYAPRYGPFSQRTGTTLRISTVPLPKEQRPLCASVSLSLRYTLGYSTP